MLLWPHPSCLPQAEFAKLCTVTTGRSGGPGGQNRNKVETHVVVTHTASGLHAQAGERRSQLENRQMAIRRLRLELAVNWRCAVPKGRGLEVLDSPAGSPLWRSRVSGRRIACNPDHYDYPSMLAEAMDVLAHHTFDTRQAALMLDVSSSQLLRLLADHPPALIKLNDERAKRGQHPLKA